MNYELQITITNYELCIMNYALQSVVKPFLQHSYFYTEQIGFQIVLTIKNSSHTVF